MTVGVLIAAAVLAQAPSEPVFEVVRLGDNRMTCEALIGEINALNGEMMRVQSEMTERATDMTRGTMGGLGGMGGGAAMSLGSFAASFIPGADVVMGTVGSIAAQAEMARQERRMIEDVEAMTSAGAALGPISGRVEHLSEISRDKGC
jgi:hypothetical protein